MLRILDRPARLCDGVSRRELMRVGGLSMLGLSLPAAAALTRANPIGQRSTFGRAKNVIFLFLSGGAPQHETFDPKPQAPVDIRGVFNPIATNVPGIDFCELLPRTARIADKLAVIRSMCTDDNAHESSGAWVLTGYKYVGANPRETSPLDWPCFGSVVKQLKPSATVPFTSVTIPEPMLGNPGVVITGQSAGVMGKAWDPELFTCDPSQPGFKIDTFNLPGDVPPLRLSSRQTLRSQMESHFRALERGDALGQYDRLVQESFGVLSTGRAREAFDLAAESDSLRQRYGRGKWGQTVLLARRLVEAGVRFVQVNWPREPGDLSANNPLWDTHAQHNARCKDALCPPFDLGFSALIEDLDRRGLLDETLVVCVGEFGRTPKFNSAGGRDHWGPVFSCVLAGAGIAGAQTFGASDRDGAYVASNKVPPQDLTATIAHLLGISPEATFPDQAGRPRRVSEGEPLFKLLGAHPATEARVEPGGVVPILLGDSLDPLVDREFQSPLAPAGPKGLERGWQADPLLDESSMSLAARDAFGVGREKTSGGRHFATLGYGAATGAPLGTLAAGSRCLLAQEVLNPRPGTYTLRVELAGAARDEAAYREAFLKHFRVAISIFGYADLQKDCRKVVAFATKIVQPPFSKSEATFEPFEVSARLRSQEDGAGELNHGIGAAITLARATDAPLDLSALPGPGLLRVARVELLFDPFVPTAS